MVFRCNFRQVVVIVASLREAVALIVAVLVTVIANIAIAGPIAHITSIVAILYVISLDSRRLLSRHILLFFDCDVIVFVDTGLGHAHTLIIRLHFASFVKITMCAGRALAAIDGGAISQF
jgi:hypothetical protein